MPKRITTAGPNIAREQMSQPFIILQEQRFRQEQAMNGLRHLTFGPPGCENTFAVTLTANHNNQ